jgi:beta-phosphoglucomutase
MGIHACIFDLDGVIVSTDEYHYLAWKRLAEEEKIRFDRTLNDALRGISRMESLEILLRRSRKNYSQEEKESLAERKNTYYRETLKKLTPKSILPGVQEILQELKQRGIKAAIGSSSKNAWFILKQIALDTSFDAVVDGNAIRHSKPDPEVFLMAAQMLGLPAVECAVVEDADAGVEAAVAAGMKVVGVGPAASNPSVNLKAKDLHAISVSDIICLSKF